MSDPRLSDPRPLLRALATEDRPGAVWCAGHCALSVAHLWRGPKPRRAVRLALAWAVGVPVPEERLRAAAANAASANAAYANAAYAAAYASYASDASAYAANAAYAAAYASYAAYAAAYAANGAAYAAYAAARQRHLAVLHTYVLHEMTPIAPSAWWVRHARPAAQVVWDVAASDLPPARVGTLGDALRRARVLRLRWHQPIERAIAERLDLDHPALVALRRSVGGRCLQCGTTGRVPA